MSVHDETCDVCGKPCSIKEHQGAPWMSLDMWVHWGVCNDLVLAVRRDFSKSERGRYRSRGEILKLIRKQALEAMK